MALPHATSQGRITEICWEMHRDGLFTPLFHPDQTLLNLWEGLPTPHLDRHLRAGETRDGLSIEETGIVQDDDVSLTYGAPFHRLQNRMARPHVFERLIYMCLGYFRNTTFDLPPMVSSEREI